MCVSRTIRLLLRPGIDELDIEDGEITHISSEQVQVVLKSGKGDKTIDNGDRSPLFCEAGSLRSPSDGNLTADFQRRRLVHFFQRFEPSKKNSSFFRSSGSFPMPHLISPRVSTLIKSSS